MNDAMLSHADAVPPGCSTATGPPGFELLAEVGRGGMGVVWRARDLALDREVAIKLLGDRYAPDSATARRFVDEARITGQLQHPGIPAVYQVGSLSDGRPFLAMKLIKGDTLEAKLKLGETLDPLRVFEAVAQAIGFAHSHGVIHRDLKPANVMVGAFGEVQVLDWGLAKVLGASNLPAEIDPEMTIDTATVIRTTRDSDGTFTQAGSVLGTPAYMAPEQAAGETHRIDTRSDVFGLGAVLCVLLTGRPPFSGTDAESVRLNAVRGKTEAAIAALDASGADPGVVALCKRCLATEPADRPASGDVVAAEVAALRAAADERAQHAERDRHAAEVQAAESRKRRRVLAGLAIALLIGIAGTTVGMVRAEAARDAEAIHRRKAEEKEAEAAAVLKYFDDKVFAAARPKGQDGGLGKDVTLREAIMASLPALDTEFKTQPLVEARLRLSLAATLYYLGDATAIIHNQKARAIYTDHLGPDHADTLLSANALANSYLLAGRHTEAMTLREQILAARRRVLPAGHLDILKSETNLANSYADAARHAEALVLREEALAGFQRGLGNDHPFTLLCMNNLATSYSAHRRFQDSLKLRIETRDAYRRLKLADDHPDMLRSMSNLANSYAEAGDPENALKLRRETLTVRQRVLPPEHPDILMSMSNVAYSLAALGQYQQALADHEKILEVRRRNLPPNDPEILMTLHNIGDCEQALGRHPQALKRFQEVLAGRRQVLAANHPDRLISLWCLARSLLNNQQGPEAIPLIDEYLTAVAALPTEPIPVATVLEARLRHFQKLQKLADCRATAAMWEQRNSTDSESLVVAARFRAIIAAVNPDKPNVDADRAMTWLTKAIAAGYRDRTLLETDADFAALRVRDDFTKLLETLPKPGK